MGGGASAEGAGRAGSGAPRPGRRGADVAGTPVAGEPAVGAAGPACPGRVAAEARRWTGSAAVGDGGVLSVLGATGPARPDPVETLRWTGGAVAAGGLDGSEDAGAGAGSGADSGAGTEADEPGSPGPLARATAGSAVVFAAASSATAAACFAAGFAAAVAFADGSARRWTAGAAGAVVSVVGRAVRTAVGGMGRTRGPTGRSAVGATDAGPASAAASCRATGRDSEGAQRPGDGSPDVATAPRTNPPGAPSRTAWDSVPAKEGFCQVVSEPPKPELATPPGGRAAAIRWIGGRPDQPAPAPRRSAVSGRAVTSGRAVPSARAAPASEAASGAASWADAGDRRPRSLSRSPTTPPPWRV